MLTLTMLLVVAGGIWGLVSGGHLSRLTGNVEAGMASAGFGVSGGAKISIVFLGCVFPILINSYYGMRVVNREYVELARSFRLNSRALFFKILLPASVPFVLSGVRLAIGRGLTGVAIAEWFGATEGLGYLIFFAGQTLNIPTLFVGVAVFAALGIFGFEVVRRVEAYATPWKKDARVS